MNIKIHSIHFDADKKLQDFINYRLKKLLVFYDDIITAEVFLRLENVWVIMKTRLRKSDWRFPVILFLLKNKAIPFEESTDNAIEALRRQLQKHKGKVRRV